MFQYQIISQTDDIIRLKSIISKHKVLSNTRKKKYTNKKRRKRNNDENYKVVHPRVTILESMLSNININNNNNTTHNYSTRFKRICLGERGGWSQSFPDIVINNIYSYLPTTNQLIDLQSLLRLNKNWYQCVRDGITLNNWNERIQNYNFISKGWMDRMYKCIALTPDLRLDFPSKFINQWFKVNVYDTMSLELQSTYNNYYNKDLLYKIIFHIYSNIKLVQKSVEKVCGEAVPLPTPLIIEEKWDPVVNEKVDVFDHDNNIWTTGHVFTVYESDSLPLDLTYVVELESEIGSIIIHVNRNQVDKLGKHTAGTAVPCSPVDSFNSLYLFGISLFDHIEDKLSNNYYCGAVPLHHLPNDNYQGGWKGRSPSLINGIMKSIYKNEQELQIALSITETIFNAYPDRDLDIVFGEKKDSLTQDDIKLYEFLLLFILKKQNEVSTIQSISLDDLHFAQFEDLFFWICNCQSLQSITYNHTFIDPFSTIKTNLNEIQAITLILFHTLFYNFPYQTLKNFKFGFTSLEENICINGCRLLFYFQLLVSNCNNLTYLCMDSNFPNLLNTTNKRISLLYDFKNNDQLQTVEFGGWSQQHCQTIHVKQNIWPENIQQFIFNISETSKIKGFMPEYIKHVRFNIENGEVFAWGNFSFMFYKETNVLNFNVSIKTYFEKIQYIELTCEIGEIDQSILVFLAEKCPRLIELKCLTCTEKCDFHDKEWSCESMVQNEDDDDNIQRKINIILPEYTELYKDMHNPKITLCQYCIYCTRHRKMNIDSDDELLLEGAVHPSI